MKPKKLRTTALLAVALTLGSLPLQAQMLIVRPAEKPPTPKVIPVSISKAEASISESNSRLSKRTAATRRRTPRTQAATMSLPPLEFTVVTESELTPRIDLSKFSAPRPESRCRELEQASVRPIPVGDAMVGIPDCLEILESSTDFFIGALDDVLQIDSWQFDETYKLSTPEAYIRYITRLYNGAPESTVTNGDKTEIAGFDTESGKSYRVAMQKSGSKFYVTRMVYRPAVESAVTNLFPTMLNL